MSMRSAAILAAAIAALAPSATRAFTAAPSTPPSRARTGPLRATVAVAELQTMSKEEQLALLGVEDEDKLALGIDPDEVLEHIGTRADLVAKFKADIPKFSPTQAEAAADAFLLDGEMLDLYLKYQIRKAEDPGWEPQYRPEPGPVDKVVGFISEFGIWFVGAYILKDVASEYLFKEGADVPPALSGAVEAVGRLGESLPWAKGG